MEVAFTSNLLLGRVQCAEFIFEEQLNVSHQHIVIN